jgi:hypothetical protein
MSALEEITMDEFKPSANFISRTMEEIRSYEKDLDNKRDRLNAFLLSRQMRFALSAAAVLLGILNLIRMASILISPALCL